jgi:hypothetical protein
MRYKVVDQPDGQRILEVEGCPGLQMLQGESIRECVVRSIGDFEQGVHEPRKNADHEAKRYIERLDAFLKQPSLG